MNSVSAGPDGLPRCSWCLATAEYRDYHDTEWGFPTSDDRRLFEKLCLEGFQSGLSWRTILAKRASFRAAFDGFDFHRVARYDERDIERLLADAGIVRHRGKITAAINNARCACEMVARHGSLAAWLWRFAPAHAGRPAPRELPATSPESTTLSKELKRLGWRFVGPTTMYAFMQSMGFVNDHAEDCTARAAAAQAREAFEPPTAS